MGSGSGSSSGHSIASSDATAPPASSAALVAAASARSAKRDDVMNASARAPRSRSSGTGDFAKSAATRTSRFGPPANAQTSSYDPTIASMASYAARTHAVVAAAPPCSAHASRASKKPSSMASRRASGDLAHAFQPAPTAVMRARATRRDAGNATTSLRKVRMARRFPRAVAA